MQRTVGRNQRSEDKASLESETRVTQRRYREREEERG